MLVPGHIDTIPNTSGKAATVFAVDNQVGLKILPKAIADRGKEVAKRIRAAPSYLNHGKKTFALPLATARVANQSDKIGIVRLKEPQSARVRAVGLELRTQC